MVQTSSIIVAPRLAASSRRKEDPIECSLHTLPKPLMREFQHVFGEKYKGGDGDDNGDCAMGDANSNSSSGSVEILAVPTNQHARHDLVAVGDHIEAEKDRLLNSVRIELHCIVRHCIVLYCIVIHCDNVRPSRWLGTIHAMFLVDVVASFFLPALEQKRLTTKLFFPSSAIAVALCYVL